MQPKSAVAFCGRQMQSQSAVAVAVEVAGDVCSGKSSAPKSSAERTANENLNDREVLRAEPGGIHGDPHYREAGRARAVERGDSADTVSSRPRKTKSGDGPTEGHLKANQIRKHRDVWGICFFPGKDVGSCAL